MASPTYAEPLLSQTDEGPVSSPATALSLGNSSFPNRSQALVRKTRRQALSFVYLASALGAVGGIAVGHQLRLTETSALFRKNATDRSSVSGPNRLPHWLNSSDEPYVTVVGEWVLKWLESWTTAARFDTIQDLMVHIPRRHREGAPGQGGGTGATETTAGGRHSARRRQRRSERPGHAV